MNKKYFIANWKMNPKTLVEAENLLAMYGEAAKGIKSKKTAVGIAAPFLWLEDLIKKNKSGQLEFGAQNCFWEREGAFTGEVSPLMLKNSGCSFVILGHSERRRLGETDEMINLKVKAALKERLKIVLCVGESKISEENKDGYLEIKEELLVALRGVKSSSLSNVIVAYEPVWAISSNLGAQADSPDNALSSILYLRKLAGEIFDRRAAQEIKIIYGGSVNAKNIGDYFSQQGIDGVLVGGASLNGSEVIKMIKEIKD